MKLRFLLPLSCAFAAAIAAAGAELTVTSNADSGDGTLRALCASAAKGDTIRIPAGMTITLDSEITTTEKAVKFLGDPSDRPVITASGTGYRAIQFGKGSTPYEFRDLVFRGFDVGTGSGGALYLSAYTPAPVLVSNVLFDACSAKQGAGFYSSRDDDILTVVECEFRNCTTTEGYAFMSKGRTFMERCRFDGNTAEKGAGAATVAYVNSGTSSWIARDCMFVNNTGTTGGAVFFNNIATNELIGCTFATNSAPTGKGGAIYGRTNYTLRNCTFRRNSAGTGGGAIYRYDGQMDLFDCVFEENSTAGSNSNGNEGGAAVSSHGTTGKGESIVSNCVFRCNYNEEGSGVGGALFCYVSADQTTSEIVDCLFEGNRALAGSGALTLSGASTVRSCTFITNACEKTAALYIDTTDTSEAQGTPDAAKPCLVENCTFFGNVSSTDKSVVWVHSKNQKIGDVNYACRVQLTMRNCTFAGNRMYHKTSGALYLNNGTDTDSRVDLTACVFRDNLCSQNSESRDIYHPLRTANAVVTDQAAASGTFSVYDVAGSAGNYFGGALGDPLLDAFPAANDTRKILPDGTALPTLAFASASPLRDCVTVATAAPCDARGVERGRGATLADIGAYEFVPAFSGTCLVFR